MVLGERSPGRVGRRPITQKTHHPDFCRWCVFYVFTPAPAPAPSQHRHRVVRGCETRLSLRASLDSQNAPRVGAGGPGVLRANDNCVVSVRAGRIVLLVGRARDLLYAVLGSTWCAESTSRTVCKHGPAGSRRNCRSLREWLSRFGCVPWAPRKITDPRIARRQFHSSRQGERECPGQRRTPREDRRLLLCSRDRLRALRKLHIRHRA